MSDRLVICSSPVDDDIVGREHNADFCNITEHNWDDLKLKIKKYKKVICVQNSSSNAESIWLLITFARLNNLECKAFENSFYVDKTIKKDIKANEVLFIGCSHTFGKGHSTNETVYPYQLCELLNKDLLIDAHPGKGNWLTEEKLQNYNLQNATVVIQFTSIARISLNNRHVVGHNFSKSESDVFTDEVLACEFVKSVKRIVNYLRSNNTKFAFIYIAPYIPIHNEIMSIMSEYKEYVHLIDSHKDTGDLGHHSGALSHKYWAEELYAKLSL